MWHEITIQEPSPEGNFDADVRIPSASPWFEGHFPENPVLPGIAQLGLVFDLIRKSLRADVQIKQVSRVRFKQMVRPNDQMTVRVYPKTGHSGQYAFRIFKDAELICLGDIMVALEGRTSDINDNCSGEK